MKLSEKLLSTFIKEQDDISDFQKVQPDQAVSERPGISITYENLMGPEYWQFSAFENEEKKLGQQTPNNTAKKRSKKTFSKNSEIKLTLNNDRESSDNKQTITGRSLFIKSETKKMYETNRFNFSAEEDAIIK